MTAATRNLSASVRARLRNISIEQRRPFQEIVQYYGIERFLYRLSVSDYANVFILKGGVVFLAWGIGLRRPTRDIDLHGQTDNALENLIRIIREICVQTVERDGVVFDSNTVSGEPIQTQGEYAGVRIQFTGYLGTTQIPMQVDVGFSDKISPPAKQVTYPTLLGMAEPRLRGYSHETVIAEKLQVMVFWGSINTRLKDFYDLWVISREVSIDGDILSEAILTTFNARKTHIPEGLPTSLSNGSAPQLQQQWLAFLRRFNGENEQLANFMSIIEELRLFLDPVILAASTRTSFRKTWHSGLGWK